MVEELRLLFERAEQQPEDVQHRLAELLRLELEEEEADAIDASPELLARLAESRRQIANGEYVTLDVLDRHRHE